MSARNQTGSTAVESGRQPAFDVHHRQKFSKPQMLVFPSFSPIRWKGGAARDGADADDRTASYERGSTVVADARLCMPPMVREVPLAIVLSSLCRRVLWRLGPVLIAGADVRYG